MQEVDRFLYIFACLDRFCPRQTDSWLALRISVPPAVKASLPAVTDTVLSPIRVRLPPCVVTAGSEWGLAAVGGDDWGHDDTGVAEEALKAFLGNSTKANQGASGGTVVPPPTVSKPNSGATAANTAVLPAAMAPSLVTLQPYYLSVFDEPTNEASTCSHALQLLRQYETKEGRPANCLDVDFEKEEKKLSSAAPRRVRQHGGVHEEAYEKTVAPHGDETFERFAHRIARYPRQVLRYHLGGTHLPVRTQSCVPATPPACVHCGAPTAYELQLLPSLVSHLYPVGRSFEVDNEVLAFATVAVFTCTALCWHPTDAFRLEHVFVDPEEALPVATAQLIASVTPNTAKTPPALKPR